MQQYSRDVATGLSEKIATMGPFVLRPPRQQLRGTDPLVLPDQDPPQRKGERNSFAETDYVALLDAS